MFKNLFGASRQAKRDDAELGKGVWRRDHDRFRRGLDRFHQMLEGLAEAGPAAPAGASAAQASASTNASAAPAGAASAAPASASTNPGTEAATGAEAREQAADKYQAMVMVANGLADLLPAVRAIVMEAQRMAPSEGSEIPLGTGGYLNDVHRELSRAGNALAAASEALALVRLGIGEVSGVQLKSGIVRRHVSEAGQLLHKTSRTDG